MTRKEYMKDYRAKNREKINQYQRAWYASHKGKATEYSRRYWEKKAKETEPST